MSEGADCPKCGKPMAWKNLKKQQCFQCEPDKIIDELQSVKTFDMCVAIRNHILTVAASCIEYRSWSDAFCVAELIKVEADLKKQKFKDVDPTKLTDEQMKQLGFHRWSEETKARLIPLWLKPYLIDEFIGYKLNGDQVTLRRDEIDNDHRFGMLAYLVMPSDVS